MKLLVFQHIDCEHPGIFRQFFDEARIEWHAVKLDSGEPGIIAGPESPPKNQPCRLSKTNPPLLLPFSLEWHS